MELKGKGFTIRSWKEEDLISLQKHADNPNISAFALDRFPWPYTMDDAVSWIGLMLKQQPEVSLVIAIDDNLVGGIGIDLREDVYRKTALIGYWLSEEYWGRGIMTEAVKLATKHFFENFDILRLQAGVFSNNPRSMRVLEKAGYVKEGVLKRSVIKRGEVLDEHVYACLRCEI